MAPLNLQPLTADHVPGPGCGCSPIEQRTAEGEVLLIHRAPSAEIPMWHPGQDYDHGYRAVYGTRCRGATCGRLVVMAKNDEGKWRPYDPTGTPHHATCPDVAGFRKDRPEREPLAPAPGLLDGLAESS